MASKEDRATMGLMLLDRRVTDDNRETVYKCMRDNFDNRYSVEQIKDIIENDVEPHLQKIRANADDTIAFLRQGGSTFKFSQSMAAEFGETDIVNLATTSRPQLSKTNGNGRAPKEDGEMVANDNQKDSKKRGIENDSGGSSKRPRNRSSKSPDPQSKFPSPPQLSSQHQGKSKLATVAFQLLKAYKGLAQEYGRSEEEFKKAAHFAVVAGTADWELGCEFVQHFIYNYEALQDNRYFFSQDDEELQQFGITEGLLKKYGQDVLKKRQHFLEHVNYDSIGEEVQEIDLTSL